MSNSDAILDWLNAPEDVPAPTVAASRVVAAAPTPTSSRSRVPSESVRAPSAAAAPDSSALLRLQLSEQEARAVLLQAESADMAECSRCILKDALGYVRDREQSLIFSSNKRLIANDLISELVAANQQVTQEFGQVMSMLQQTAIMRAAAPAVAAAPAPVAKKSKR